MGGGERQIMWHTKEVVEQLAAVLVRVEPVVDVELQTGVDMSVVQLSV
jgi:hypothetical protein